MNDLYWIGPVLISGLLAVRSGLPPLVGYLIAGFVLNALGFVDQERLVAVGDLGVIHADATDNELRARTGKGKVSVALLALPESEQIPGVAKEIRSRHAVVRIFAVAQYPEEVATLKAVGVETTWDLYVEAGKGFAEEVIDHLGDTIEKTITPTASSTPPQTPACA